MWGMTISGACLLANQPVESVRDARTQRQELINRREWKRERAKC